MYAVAEAGEARRERFVPGGGQQRTNRLPAIGATPGAVDQDVATHARILRAGGVYAGRRGSSPASLPGGGLRRAEGYLAGRVAGGVVVADNVVLSARRCFAAADALSGVPDDGRKVAANSAGVAGVGREVVAVDLAAPGIGDVGNRERACGASPDVLAVLVVGPVLKGSPVGDVSGPGVGNGREVVIPDERRRVVAGAPGVVVGEQGGLIVGRNAGARRGRSLAHGGSDQAKRQANDDKSGK